MATTTITELDLSTCHPNSLSNRINAVPGLKTSTAFFTFLRANLVLPDSAMSSNVSTPYLEPTASHTLAPPSPSPLATSMTAANPSAPASTIGASEDNDIPPLSLDIVTEKDDKVAALKLVADSIAQQRQQASSHLFYHPLCIAGLAATLAVAYQVPKSKDLGTLTTLGCGIIMSYLLAIRYLTGPYIKFAEELNWSFLTDPSTEEEDIIIATKFGTEIVGALILRLEGTHPSPKKKSKQKGGKGVIRAWTTKLRYRGKGVGEDLLREAIRITKDRCGRDAEVGFAKEHANSQMVLPEMFNGAFRKREMRAARALEGVLGEWEGRRKR